MNNEPVLGHENPGENNLGSELEALKKDYPRLVTDTEEAHAMATESNKLRSRAALERQTLRSNESLVEDDAFFQVESEDELKAIITKYESQISEIDSKLEDELSEQDRLLRRHRTHMKDIATKRLAKIQQSHKSRVYSRNELRDQYPETSTDREFFGESKHLWEREERQRVINEKEAFAEERETFAQILHRNPQLEIAGWTVDDLIDYRDKTHTLKQKVDGARAELELLTDMVDRNSFDIDEMPVSHPSSRPLVQLARSQAWKEYLDAQGDKTKDKRDRRFLDIFWLTIEAEENVLHERLDFQTQIVLRAFPEIDTN